MVARDGLEAINQSVLPVLIDNTRKAHRLSARLFRRFGVVSLICGKPHLCDLWDLSSRTLRLPTTDCERLRVEELLDLASQSEGLLLLLIPCSDEARAMIARHAQTLERCFILSDADTVFSLSPLSDLERACHSSYDIS